MNSSRENFKVENKEMKHGSELMKKVGNLGER